MQNHLLIKLLKEVRAEQMLHTDILLKIISALQVQAPLQHDFLKEFQQVQELHRQKFETFLDDAYAWLNDEDENKPPTLKLQKLEDPD